MNNPYAEQMRAEILGGTYHESMLGRNISQSVEMRPYTDVQRETWSMISIQVIFGIVRHIEGDVKNGL